MLSQHLRDCRNSPPLDPRSILTPIENYFSTLIVPNRSGLKFGLAENTGLRLPTIAGLVCPVFSLLNPRTISQHEPTCSLFDTLMIQGLSFILFKRGACAPQIYLIILYHKMTHIVWVICWLDCIHLFSI